MDSTDNGQDSGSAQLPELGLDEFVRSIGVNKTRPHAVFLGAGASISSQVFSAEQCIREWKRRIFLTNNPGLEAQFSEISLPSVMQRIQRWLDAQGCYPASGAASEYEVYAEKCFPVAADRCAFFQEKTKSAQPSAGYRYLSLLAEDEIIRSVWTTNFDGLMAKAAAGYSVTPIEVGMDSKSRAFRQPARGELLCVALHGDYRYDSLKNTSKELQEQEAELATAFKQHVTDHSLIVCGYSGRDKSIMDMLTGAYSQKGTGALYWCGYDDIDLLPASVYILLDNARNQGRAVFYVPTRGFDDLYLRLALHCLQGNRRDSAVKISQIQTDERQPVVDAFHVPELPAVRLLKSNSFQITCPTEIYQFELNTWPTENVYRQITDIGKTHGVVAAPLKGRVYALGNLDDVRLAFGANIKGEIARTPVTDRDLSYSDGAIISIFTSALTRSIAQASGFSTDGRRYLWGKNSRQEKTGTGICLVSDAVSLHLRLIAGKTYLVVEPTLKVTDLKGQDVDIAISKAVKTRLLSNQHNKEFNQAVGAWRDATLKQQQNYEFPPNSASPFKFYVWKAPDFAAIGSNDSNRSFQIPSGQVGLVTKHGMELREPALIFSSTDGRSTQKDVHPLRGLLANRPYDYALTRTTLASDVSVGVICPSQDAGRFRDFIAAAHNKQNPNVTEEDYLLPYPGFQNAYRLPISLPNPGDACWIDSGEPANGSSAEKGAVEIAKSLRTAIDRLLAAARPCVILIYIPARWQVWREFTNAVEHFDLHDFVKAYCVERGIATQFIEEDTLSSSQQCRVWWWLSLALYVKSMRIPWILDSLDSDTAYVGLGFCMSRRKDVSKHIVMGCSHIYSSQGQGLQYRLSKIENPILFDDNPHMSRDDARRVAETILQLYFDAQMKLPQRVVLHKLTPFKNDERLGLLDALSAVGRVDMIGIHTDPCLRYVSSIRKSDGKFDDDNFPVRRGTLMPIEKLSALLWVHGVTDHVTKPNYRYYQGKRRIPAPLVMTRYWGKTDVATLGQEILGLSKMNWNSGDMYAKLPATVQSSKHIANIGSLLDRFTDHSFDYRLFI